MHNLSPAARAVLGVVLLVGCGTSGTAATAPTKTPAAAAAPTPPLAAPAVHAVGDTITTTTGESFTVLEYVDHFTSTNPYDKPAPGGFFAAIRVKACASSEQLLSVNPAEIALVEPDDSRLTEAAVAGGKIPSLDSATLQPTECASGWINYAVTARPKQIALSNSDLRWALP